MTNERAIELLNRISDSQFDGPHGDERREALSMAVRALESNLVKESGDLVQDLVKDCISRQAAIDAVNLEYATTEVVNNRPVNDYERELYIRIRGKLSELPSAQPERQVELDGTESNIEILSELRAQFNCFDEVEEPCYRALSDAICALSAQPERKKGKWIEKEYSPFYCSVCGTYQYSASWEIKNKEYNFCPRCGARMER